MAGKPRLSRILGLVIGVPLFVAAVYMVFFVRLNFEETEEPEPPIRPLKILEIGPPRTVVVNRYPGRVRAYQEVPLAFQVPGQLMEFPVSKGKDVKAGDVLGKLDPRDYENDLATRTADYNRTKVHLERVAKAASSGAVSGTDLTNAQADMQMAEAQMRIAQKALDDTVLYAPFGGVVANTLVENFEDVRAKQPVLSLQDVRGNIDIEVSVPESRIVKGKWPENEEEYRDLRVRSHLLAVFDYLPGREFEVTIREFAIEADPATQTYLVTLTMPQPRDAVILPGMTATVVEHWFREPEEGEPGVFAVPIEATVVDVPPEATREPVSAGGVGQYYVWLVSGEAGGTLTVHRRNIEVAGMTDGSVTVREGLKEGDRIAGAGVHFLQEGQKVIRYVPKAEGGET